MAAKLATSVPQLCVYENLELHFEWICDGCIKGMVEENLPRELMFLEKYLLSIGVLGRRISPAPSTPSQEIVTSTLMLPVPPTAGSAYCERRRSIGKLLRSILCSDQS